MERKNTMLLTIIAVATLLVAVVGATFAYFTATAEISGETGATVTGSATFDGAVVVTNKGATMHINLGSTQMANYNELKPYYATAGTSDYVTTEETATFATMANSGTDPMDCTFGLTITDTAETNSMITADATTPTGETAHDLVITLAGTGITDTEIKSTDFTSGTYTASGLTVSRITSAQDLDYTVSAYLPNTTATQNKLKNTNLSFTVSITDVECTVSQAS